MQRRQKFRYSRKIHLISYKSLSTSGGLVTPLERHMRCFNSPWTFQWTRARLDAVLLWKASVIAMPPLMYCLDTAWKPKDAFWGNYCACQFFLKYCGIRSFSLWNAFCSLELFRLSYLCAISLELNYFSEKQSYFLCKPWNSKSCCLLTNLCAKRDS